MKSTKTLLAVALATAGLALASQAQAAGGTHTGGGGHWSGGHASGGHWSGGGHWGGGHFRGGYGGARLGFYLGVPLLWSSWYWGYPYDYYWPRTVIYREVERAPEAVYEDAAPTTEVPRGAQGGAAPGAPTRAPAYRNYCESAKAYFPKVTSCPEGWRFEPVR